MAATNTRYYNSTMRGLGGIDGTPGSLTSILDKVTSLGYGEVTAINITVSGGIARANFNLNESFQVNSTIRVSGSNIAALNGDHLVTDASNSYASWPTGAADGVTSTTVTVKGAPLGFNIAFTDTNKRGYTSSSLESTGHFISVDDTTAKYATIFCYEKMTGISTGIGRNPAQDSQSDWPKSQTADTTKRDWIIIGDDRGFYYGIAAPTNTLSVGDIGLQPWPFTFYFVGEAIDETPIKQHCFLLFSERNVQHFGRVTSATTYSGIAVTDYSVHGSYPGYVSHTVSRDFLGSSKSPRIRLQTEMGIGVSGRFGAGPPYPNPGNNKTFLTRITVHEETTNMRRGTLPGAYALAHNGSGSLTTTSIIENVEGLENRILMCFASTKFSSTFDSLMIFDITGNWRQ